MAVAPTAANQQQKPEEPKPLTTEQEIVQEFQRKRQGQQQIMQQIASIEGEIHEHNLVLDQLKDLNGDRRAHRLVGGALIEKTVGEIRPEIEDTLSKFNAHMKNLQDNLVKKEKEIEQFMNEYKISISQPNQQQQQQVSAAAAGAKDQDQKGGVLA